MNPRKLTDYQVEEIRRRSSSEKKSDLAREFGVSPQLVSTVVKYGYDQRPPSWTKPKVGSIVEAQESHQIRLDSWECVAERYNERNPEDVLTAQEAQEAHDSGIEKLRILFLKKGWTSEV